MKLLTLNTHSLQERNYPDKLGHFVRFVLREAPDVIALQEVNQMAGAPSVPADRLRGRVPVPGETIPVRADNHALAVVEALRRGGLAYHWAWHGFKLGYGRYDEGLALLSRRPMAEAACHLLSDCDAYTNWRTRKVLGFRPVDSTDWFYTVHMGWWADAEEPFRAQWARLEAAAAPRKQGGTVWLLGDFNAPAAVRGESYDCMAQAGWFDTYRLAERRDDGVTAPGAIDGWPGQTDGLRIDQIWCSKAVGIPSSRVVLDGKQDPVVSDHYGVLVETADR